MLLDWATGQTGIPPAVLDPTSLLILWSSSGPTPAVSSGTRVTQLTPVPVQSLGETRVTQLSGIPVQSLGETRVTQMDAVPVQAAGVTRVTQMFAMFLLREAEPPPECPGETEGTIISGLSYSAPVIPDCPGDGDTVGTSTDGLSYDAPEIAACEGDGDTGPPRIGG